MTLGQGEAKKQAICLVLALRDRKTNVNWPGSTEAFGGELVGL